MQIVCDELTIDLSTRTLKQGQGTSMMSQVDGQILNQLVKANPQPATKDSLCKAAGLSPRGLEGAIKRLRGLLPDGWVLTVRGRGFLYNGPAPTPGASGRLKSLPSGGVLDASRSVVMLPDGSDVTLTDLEFGLLQALMLRQGQGVSLLALLRQVWGNPRAVNIRAVDNVVYRLRKKLMDPMVVVTASDGLALGGNPQRRTPGWHIATEFETTLQRDESVPKVQPLVWGVDGTLTEADPNLVFIEVLSQDRARTMVEDSLAFAQGIGAAKDAALAKHLAQLAPPGHGVLRQKRRGPVGEVWDHVSCLPSARSPYRSMPPAQPSSFARNPANFPHEPVSWWAGPRSWID